MKNIGVKIDEYDQTFMLLLSLHESYENLIQTLIFVSDTLTMDKTITSLLAYDLWKVATSEMSSSGREDRKQAQGLFFTREKTD